MRLLALVSAFALATTAAAAQQGVVKKESQIELKQLEMQTSTRGFAILAEPDGHEHYCDVKNGKDAVEIGPCKPIVLVTPLRPQVAPEPQVQTVDPARLQVVRMFESNRCTISYGDLSATLAQLGARQRQVIAQTIAAMTEAGEIVDDLRTERATLKTGTRCR